MLGISSNLYTQRHNYTPNSLYFGAKKPKIAAEAIPLDYILDNVPKEEFPPLVLDAVNNIIKNIPEYEWPALYDVHKEVYKPLLDCKTLEEAKALFPEFSEAKSSKSKEFTWRSDSKVYEANMGKIPLVGNEDFTLFLMKKLYGEAVSKTKLADELGVTRKALIEIEKKLNFPPLSLNYAKYLKNTNQDYFDLNSKRMSDRHINNPNFKINLDNIKTNPVSKQKFIDRMNKYDENHPGARSEMKSRYFRNPINKKEQSEIMFEYYKKNPKKKKKEDAGSSPSTSSST